MENSVRYLVWDFWTDTKGCYAVYEKKGEGKLYFSEVLKEEPKLLEQKKKVNWFKKLLKRKDK